MKYHQKSHTKYTKRFQKKHGLQEPIAAKNFFMYTLMVDQEAGRIDKYL